MAAAVLRNSRGEHMGVAIEKFTPKEPLEGEVEALKVREWRKQLGEFINKLLSKGFD